MPPSLRWETCEPVISIDDALEHRDGGGVVVSFDDGTRDFADHVLPLLVNHHVPAILYLATGLIADEGGIGLFWSQVREAVATGLVTIGFASLALAVLWLREHERGSERP